MCGSKLKFTSSYHPQADPAERANRQVMEALRAAVATVAQYDEWDLALPHITFGLNTHISTTTKLSPFEFTHGFPARVPLTFGQPSPQAPPGETLHLGAAAIANRMKMRHWAAADCRKQPLGCCRKQPLGCWKQPLFSTHRGMWWHGCAYRLFPERQFCARHTEIVSWRVILAWTAQLLPSHTRSIGQGCMLTCHILFDRALRVQLPKVAITNALGFHNSLLFLFSHLLVGPWT
jgi:hypothetical protein